MNETSKLKQNPLNAKNPKISQKVCEISRSGRGVRAAYGENYSWKHNIIWLAQLEVRTESMLGLF